MLEIQVCDSHITLWPPSLPSSQVLEIQVCDSHMTGRVEVGSVRLALADLPTDGSVGGRWLKLQVRGGSMDLARSICT